MVYLALIGDVQSGKTNEEILYCFNSINNKIPVIFIVRNIKADQLQLCNRIREYNININVSILRGTKVLEFLKSIGILIVLCNKDQLRVTCKFLEQYGNEYNVCIDEVDFSIKTKNGTSLTDVYLTKIKNNAKNILGATATPFALFSTEKKMVVKKLHPSNKYHGINSLNVQHVASDIRNFAESDTIAITEIYDALLAKERAFILHSVTKKKELHTNIMHHLAEKYPSFTVLTYNGDGISLMSNNRPSLPFTKKVSANMYGQIINKYYFIDNVHFFQNWAISEVLQLLVDDPVYKHTHISVISGHLASRGISFVSSDYSLHLTDQYFTAGKKTHGENYIQSLRILGCYSDSLPLTLWCSKYTWENILEHNEIIHRIINELDGSMEWMAKIKEITVNKPKNGLTRPNLADFKFNRLKSFYTLDLQ